MDLENINSKELASIGLAFETEAEVELFAEIILEELQVRIGEEITRQAPQGKLQEFDKCTDPEEAKEWLENYCPNYGVIISEKKKELEQEIVKYKDKISGAIIMKERKSH